MEDSYSRRSVLTGAAIGVTGAVAGCLGGSGDGGATTPDVDTVANEPDYSGWFEDVENYDGTYDYTGRDEVTVAVGASGNGGNFAFAPAAIAVSTGTTVVWDWTGQAGPHNVVHRDGAFASERKSGDDAQFTHEFTETGTYRYVCEPHVSFGMKGAVVVRE
ncbi:MAG: halocyanin domain-containing protein [Halobacterium sp.]